MATERAVFQLRKYSWANDKSSDGKSNYTHITAENLCLIVEGSVDSHGRLALQVVQATNVLEAIDLAYHIHTASNTRQTFQNAGRHIADRQLPTYAVFSGTKLAITYRQDDGQAHRMQVALASQLDCERIVSLLRCRGMVFVDPVQPRNDPVSVSIRPTTASTAFSRLMDRVPPQSPSSSYNSQAQSQSSVAPLFARNEQEAPRSVIIDRPTTREMFQQSVTRMNNSGISSQSHYSNAINHNDPSAELFSSNRLSGTHSLSDLDRTSNTSYHDGFEHRDTSYLPRTGDISSRHMELRSVPPAPDTQLPPPRELPFLRDHRARSSSSSALSLPALPKPQVSSQGKPSSSIKDASTTANKRKRKSDSSGPSDALLPSDADMPPPTTRPRSSMSRSSPKDMHELLHGKRPRKTPVAKKQDTVTKRKSSQSVDRIEVEVNTAGEAQQTIETQAGISPDDIARIFGQPELQEYAKLNIDDRDKILQRFIVTMLGDKAFEKLCEDVSVCWQRLAFDK